MATIIFDFDDTIFDTRQLKKIIAEKLSSYGIDLEVVNNAYHESKGRVGNYILNEHTNTLSQIHGFDVPKEFFAWFEDLPLDSYILPEHESMIKKLKNDKHILILLTKGGNEFQNEKISRSGLEKYFDEVHITSGEKHIYLSEKNFDGPVIFINDKKDENKKIKEHFPHFEVFENLKSFFE